MSKVLTHLLVLGLSAGLAPAQAAEAVPDTAPPRQVVIHADTIVLSDQAAEQLKGQTRFPGGIPVKGGKILQSSELLIQVGADGLLHLGRKHPITYYDPRANQFQVQFVDTGAKLDVHLKPSPDNDFSLDSRTEMSAVQQVRTAGTPVSAAYPLTQVFTAQNSLTHVHFGEGLVVGRARGHNARRFLDALGVPAPSGDNVMVVLTVQRP